MCEVIILYVKFLEIRAAIHTTGSSRAAKPKAKKVPAIERDFSQHWLFPRRFVPRKDGLSLNDLEHGVDLGLFKS